jgi:hypothetical protein
MAFQKPTTQKHSKSENTAAATAAPSHVQASLNEAATESGYESQAAALRPGGAIECKNSPNVQLHGSGTPTGDVHQLAAQGTQGSGRSLPHFDAIQNAFGRHDISNVQAHVGGQAATATSAMGAEAYASGSQVAFQSSPSLHLAAHEAAHVVQQRAGVSLSGGVGQVGDSYENHADSVADSVVRGDSAESLLDTMAGGSSSQSGVQQKSVQCFTKLSNTEQRTQGWNAGKGIRLSDDGKMAVGQDSKYGSQQLWAESSMIPAASAALKAAESVIRLEPDGNSIQGPAPDGSGTKSLTKVAPKNVMTGTDGDAMTIWADCGRSAGDVMGAGKGTGGGDRTAEYNDRSGAQQHTKTSGGPNRMKWEVMNEHFSHLFTRADWNELNRMNTIYSQAVQDVIAAMNARKAAEAAGDAAAEKAAEKAEETGRQRMGAAEYYMEQIYMKNYDAMSAKDKDDFDKKAEINRYAQPEVGQAYTISTGGDAKAGQEKNTWNYHWGGVAMRTGGDSVVLENYAVGVPDAKNSNWKYQMYGPPSKKGQTFHEQHRDDHAQHGESPTTLVAEERKTP